MQPSLRALRAAALLAALAVLLAAPAQAQLGTFGTQVKVGDADYLPLTKRASVAVRAMEADFGMRGDLRDNCILLLQDNTDSGAARAVAIVPPPPAAQAPATDVYAKDIRLTPCQGKGVGTAVADTDVTEQAGPYHQRAVEVRYGDANFDGKFSRGDAVYLTTMTGANRGLAASTGTGAWTLRLTPVGQEAAGTFVFPDDADFLAYRTVATGPTSPAGLGPASRTSSLVEREGNGWYIVPASAGFAAQQAIPVNSIRIGLAGVAGQQPAVTPSSIALPEEPPVAGAVYKLVVRYSNDGTGSGAGLLVTRVGDAIADARMTPVLGPGESGQAVIPVTLPGTPGPVRISVGDAKLTIDVEADPDAPADEAGEVEARLQRLEQQLAAASEVAPAAKEAKVERQGAPGVTGPASLAVLGLALLLMRRMA